MSPSDIGGAKRPVVALTGATGFLGAHLVRALAAEGFAVRVLARRPPSPPGWGGADPEIVSGDLSDDAALDRLTEGAAVVVHAAGAIKAAGLSAFLTVNREGTERIARRAGDAAFVLVSSLAAREPQLSAYAFSKRAGESAAAAIVAPERLTIVRPPAIYGPGDRETLAVFKAAAISPVLPILSPGARLALIHVEDAAAAIAAMAWRAQNGQAGQGPWALSDAQPEGYSWREILEAAAKAVGRRPLILPAPAWVLPGLARLSGLAARMSGRPALISAEKVRELLHSDWAVDASEQAVYAPKPRFGLEEGFSTTVSWYKEAGWLR